MITTKSFQHKPRLRAYGISMWAWFIYFLAAVGYFAIDSANALQVPLSTTFWNVSYTVLASIFLLDAILYFIEWWMDQESPVFLDTDAWGHLLNIVASSLYVVSSSLFFFFPQVDAAGQLAHEHATVQAALNFAAVLLFALDSLIFLSSYYAHRVSLPRHARHEQPLLRDPSLWSELLNVLPSLGYFCTGCVQLFALLDTQLQLQDVRQLQRTLANANVTLDATYAVDAVLLAWGWWQQYDAQHTVVEISTHGEDQDDDDDDNMDNNHDKHHEANRLLKETQLHSLVQ